MVGTGTKGKFNISIMEIAQTSPCKGHDRFCGSRREHRTTATPPWRIVSRYIESMYIGKVIGSRTEIMVIGQ